MHNQNATKHVYWTGLEVWNIIGILASRKHRKAERKAFGKLWSRSIKQCALKLKLQHTVCFKNYKMCLLRIFEFKHSNIFP